MRQAKVKAPVLMLTAKDGVAYKVAGLDLGAVASASGRPVSESGRLRQGAGGHRRCARRRNGLMLTTLLPEPMPQPFAMGPRIFGKASLAPRG